MKLNGLKHELWSNFRLLQTDGLVSLFYSVTHIHLTLN